MACLLGHLAATGEALVNSATFLVAGLDTAQESQIGMLASKPAVEAARVRSQRAGYLDGEDLAKVFAWLRPNDLVWNYWVNNYLLGQNPPAFDILYWNADTTRLPAGLHADFLDLFDLERPRRGHADGARHAGRPRQGRRSTPTSWPARPTTSSRGRRAYQTTQLLGGETEFVLSSSGHIQAIVNPPGNPKSSYRTGDGRAAGRCRSVARRCRDARRQLVGALGGVAQRPFRRPAAAHGARSAAPPTRRSTPRPGRYVHLT